MSRVSITMMGQHASRPARMAAWPRWAFLANHPGDAIGIWPPSWCSISWPTTRRPDAVQPGRRTVLRDTDGDLRQAALALVDLHGRLGNR